ncbi:MAG: M28 family peptidase [Chitinophagaceae bacterium]|nr:M28 family peptidase [Chitinophagaceae bacterium]
MQKSFLICFLFICSFIQAQKVADPRSFANSITVDDLKKHLYIIAGKEMEGRETATEGQRKAAVYIEDYFKSLGLLPANNGSYLMNYPVYQDSLIRSSIEVNGKPFQLFKDFAINSGFSNTSVMTANEVVFVGYGFSDSMRDDYKGINARGKIVLVLPGIPPSAQNQRRTVGQAGIQEAALKNGAAAILSVQINFPRNPSTARAPMYVNAFRNTNYPNTFTISEQIAREIMGTGYDSAREAMTNGNPQSRVYAANVLLEFNKTVNKLSSSNVLGYLEGTDKKDEYVILTAHYDHLGKRNDSLIYYGADDDGSGTVSILELAEAFVKAKKEGKGPRRSIVFMAVSGEEKGLWGSAYYSNHPSFPLEKTTVNLNIDMIGRIDPKRKQADSLNYVYVVGDHKLSSDLRTISESVNKKYTKLGLDYKYNQPNDPEQIYYRSDHYNFAKKGVPIIFYFNGTHGDYHSITDTPDKINYSLMSKRAQLVFYTAWEMANRNQMLKRDIPMDGAQRGF